MEYWICTKCGDGTVDGQMKVSKSHRWCWLRIILHHTTISRHCLHNIKMLTWIKEVLSSFITAKAFFKFVMPDGLQLPVRKLTWDRSSRSYNLIFQIIPNELQNNLHITVFTCVVVKQREKACRMSVQFVVPHPELTIADLPLLVKWVIVVKLLL